MSDTAMYTASGLGIVLSTLLSASAVVAAVNASGLLLVTTPPPPTPPLAGVRPGATVMSSFVKHSGKTIHGGDLAEWVMTKSITDCATRCRALPACTHFVVSKQSDGYACYLKKSGLMSTSSGSTTYSRKS